MMAQTISGGEVFCDVGILQSHTPHLWYLNFMSIVHKTSHSWISCRVWNEKKCGIIIDKNSLGVLLKCTNSAGYNGPHIVMSSDPNGVISTDELHSTQWGKTHSFSSVEPSFTSLHFRNVPTNLPEFNISPSSPLHSRSLHYCPSYLSIWTFCWILQPTFTTYRIAVQH